MRRDGGPANLGRKCKAFIEEWREENFNPVMAHPCLDSAGVERGAEARKVLASTRELVLKEIEKSKTTLARIAGEHHRLAFNATDKDGMPDNGIRLSAIKEFYKVLDVYPASRVDINQRTSKSEFKFSVETVLKAQELTGENIIDVESLPAHGEPAPDDEDLF